MMIIERNNGNLVKWTKKWWDERNDVNIELDECKISSDYDQ